MSQNKVPLINTAALSEFGDLTDSARFYDPEGIDRDHSYVPGYSEIARTAAIQLAEVQRGVRAPNNVQFAPVRLRWARSQTVGGQPDSTKQFGHSKKGYRLVNAKSDVGTDWLKELPPGAQIGADGSIRNGDCVLMVATAEQARKNEFTKRRLTEERTKGAEGAFAQMIENARGVNRGATPFTKTEPQTAAK